ncbi:hypothetical protein TD95_003820 [Thielaviopsis punctulata]|uniref:PH domain-containing protein n=1 Tax=Thielaviopsis punctulata TaxID=72032 RepID=A0A0F4ZGT4_9PEZI|nr:hypothetical protein TD95_003820 [Thielaviopsis punctulata]
MMRPKSARTSRDLLPSYSCSVECEGVFERKMEIENTTKRAEYRQWQTVYITLVGTALTVYAAKKDRGFGKKGGPGISPDNPPWMKKGKLIQQYSLMHADAGIAADYRNLLVEMSASSGMLTKFCRRRYVIRVRAETDQFLISCVELSTFIRWLDALFSAIDVAAPLEERDFPRDQSIPRVQRIRWLRGTQHQSMCSGNPPGSSSSAGSVSGCIGESSGMDLHGGLSAFDPMGNPESRFLAAEQIDAEYMNEEDHVLIADDDDEDGRIDPVAIANGTIPAPPASSPASASTPVPAPAPTTGPSRHADPLRRLSTTEYPHDAIDYLSGKWAPHHVWTEAHDLLYAKMCYSVLLFRSPRKSPFVVSKGTQWRVDWQTGQMTRVLPPQYNTEDKSAWEIIHTQNMKRR